jgi:hypothetical protein
MYKLYTSTLYDHMCKPLPPETTYVSCWVSTTGARAMYLSSDDVVETDQS